MPLRISGQESFYHAFGSRSWHLPRCGFLSAVAFMVAFAWHLGKLTSLKKQREPTLGRWDEPELALHFVTPATDA